jgi:hypothetical protein
MRNGHDTSAPHKGAQTRLLPFVKQNRMSAPTAAACGILEGSFESEFLAPKKTYFSHIGFFLFCLLVCQLFNGFFARLSGNLI